jgi:hypothetical protein
MVTDAALQDAAFLMIWTAACAETENAEEQNREKTASPALTTAHA